MLKLCLHCLYFPTLYNSEYKRFTVRVHIEVGWTTKHQPQYPGPGQHAKPTTPGLLMELLLLYFLNILLTENN
jgi:hypothetical protein